MGTITETESNSGPLDAKTNAELTAEVAELQRQMRELRIRMWGDEDKRALWAENKRTYVTPNIPEPPLGHIQKMEQTMLDIASSTSMLQRMLDTRLGELAKQFDFVQRVGAWIGPLMDHPDFRPPLNGDQVASKKYVDDALVKFSGAFRAEMSEPLHLARRLYKLFSQSIEIAAVTWNMQPVDPAQKRLSVIDEIATRIHITWQWVSQKRADENKPSALERVRMAAKFIATGRNGR